MGRKIPSWRTGLQRRGGFWRDGNWYDLHIDRRLPLLGPMLDELAAALPPLGPGDSVCDLACGTGNAAFSVLAAYPGVHVTLLDEDPALLALAREKLAELSEDVSLLQATVGSHGEPLPGGPYDVVVASLALDDLAADAEEGAEAEGRFELIYQGIYEALAPGGHLLVADHVGSVGLYRQMKAMERAGFIDVDCAWRQDDFFVCGGRVQD